MVQRARSEVTAGIEKLKADIALAVGENVDPSLLNDALQAIGKMLFDPQLSQSPSPVPQMWRLLMGLYIGGKIPS